MLGMLGHEVGQRPLQRGDAAEADVLVHLAQLGGKQRRRHHIAGLPARDVIGLAERADHEGTLVQLLMGQHAGMPDPVEHQVFIDFVADQVDIALADQRRQPVQLSRRDQRATGVVRAVEDDQAGPVAQGIAQALPIDGEVRQRQRHMHAAPTGQLDRGFVAVVTGVEDDDFIAGPNQRLDGTEDRLGRPRRDGHFRVGADATAVTAGNLGRHLFAQGRQAGHRRVLVMPGGNMPADRLTQGLRTIEIGKALGQVERAGFHGELRHAGEDGSADLRQFADDHR